jgi:hypothetical protein
MNKLYRATMQIRGTGELALHVLAPNAESVKDAVLSFGLYEHLIDTLNSEEVEAVKVPHGLMNEFVGKWYGKEFGSQRFGQAFLNHFGKDYPLIDAHRQGPYLWEEKNTNVALDKINGLDLLDWSAK